VILERESRAQGHRSLPGIIAEPRKLPAFELAHPFVVSLLAFSSPES